MQALLSELFFLFGLSAALPPFGKVVGGCISPSTCAVWKGGAEEEEIKPAAAAAAEEEMCL